MERIDDIGFSGFRLIQRPRDFCYGIDAVLLADFARVPKGGRICDLGTGTGILPLILKHKTQAEELFGVEVQQSAYELAVRNMELNGVADCIHILHSDVLHITEKLEAGSFDTVVSNPPYMARCGGLKNDAEAKRLARHESTAELSDFIEAAAVLLKDRGSFYMVHRPSRLADIMTACRKSRLEPKILRLVAPKEGTAANLLLLHCVKCGNPELTMQPNLVVYDQAGGYTEEIQRIYERI